MGECIPIENTEVQIVDASETGAEGRCEIAAGTMQIQSSTPTKTRDSTVDKGIEFATARIAGTQSATLDVVKSAEKNDDCECPRSRLANAQFVAKMKEGAR